MKPPKRIFQCNQCKTIYYYPADNLIETYCEFCLARGKRRQIKELFAEKQAKPTNKSMKKSN